MANLARDFSSDVSAFVVKFVHLGQDGLYSCGTLLDLGHAAQSHKSGRRNS